MIDIDSCSRIFLCRVLWTGWLVWWDFPMRAGVEINHWRPTCRIPRCSGLPYPQSKNTNGSVSMCFLFFRLWCQDICLHPTEFVASRFSGAGSLAERTQQRPLGPYPKLDKKCKEPFSNLKDIFCIPKTDFFQPTWPFWYGNSLTSDCGRQN